MKIKSGTNIWNKVKKSNKFGQDWKSFTFVSFLAAIARVLNFGGETTRWAMFSPNF